MSGDVMRSPLWETPPQRGPRGKGATAAKRNMDDTSLMTVGRVSARYVRKHSLVAG